MNMERTMVILNIPDALDAVAADQKYTDPLSQRLNDAKVGTVTAVEQGKANTPDDCSRIITVQLTDYDAGLETIQEFLVETRAPVGTMVESYNTDGTRRETFVLGPDHDS